MRAALLLLIAFGIARAGHAHEFWVQPGEFQIPPGAVLSLALQVGDGGMRQRSPIPLHRITRFDAIGPRGDALDVRASLAATAKRDLVLDAPGTYVLALATDNRAYSRQSAERFNAYLETEGLDACARAPGAHASDARGRLRALQPRGEIHRARRRRVRCAIAAVRHEAIGPAAGNRSLSESIQRATPDELSGASALQRRHPGRRTRKAHQSRTGSRASRRETQRQVWTGDFHDASRRQLAGQRRLDEAPGALVRGGLRDHLREPYVWLGLCNQRSSQRCTSP